MAARSAVIALSLTHFVSHMDPTEKGFGMTIVQTARSFISFFRRDHMYLFLGTAALCALSYLLSCYMPTRSSFLGAGWAVWVCQAALGAWLVLSAFALVVKLAHWHDYTSTFLMRPETRRVLRYLSYVAWAVCAVVIIDRVVLSVWDIACFAADSDQRTGSFLADIFFFAWKGRGLLLQGLGNTVVVALIGTLVAFLLSLILVFLHLNPPQRRDNGFVRFWKKLGLGFYDIYTTVIRGTPMMVQGSIIYFGGYSIIQNITGFQVAQMNQVWSVFVAALVTISLNSTAYLAEVLRGSIEAIDPGQSEAARSLGLTHWQAMIKVVFPQGVRNAIPAIGNEVIINIKDSSVFTFIGFFEVMYASRTIAGMYYGSTEVYITTAVIYLVLTLISNAILNAVARRLDAPVSSGVPSSN